jgi:hypothetical protein
MTDARDPIARLKKQVKDLGWGVIVDETMSFDQPDLTKLLELWRTKREAKGTLPRREDFGMRSLKPFLKHVSVLERIADGSSSRQYRIRLQGTMLAHFFGDQTGKLLEDAVPPALAERWAGVYDAVLDAGRPLRMIGTYDQESMNYLVGEALAIPLGNGDAPRSCVLSAAYFTPRHKSKL